MRAAVSTRAHRLGLVLTLAGVSLVVALPVLAHEGGDIAGGFVAGFLHPLFGFDHVVAMVAVGLWGAVLGSPAIWVLPVAFPIVMALGGALGVRGVALPGVEAGIALSAIILGLMVALAVRLPLPAACMLVGFFAIFHGHAHGTELPTAATPLAYSLGFVLATGMLHVSGIALGETRRWPQGKLIMRATGGLITAVGVYFLGGVF